MIGVVAGLALLALVGLFLVRQRKRRAQSLPVVAANGKGSKFHKGGDEMGDEVGALPQLPASLQPGTNPFLPSMLSWKPDEGVVDSTDGSTGFPAIRSARTVSNPGCSGSQGS